MRRKPEGNLHHKMDLTKRMAYGGFEQNRETLKYRCPAEHLGVSCAGKESCPVAKAIRIPLSEDRRIFTPVARSSYKWKDLYNMRSAVERVNSRIDGAYGFENHCIRGHKKMSVRIGLAFCVMWPWRWGGSKKIRWSICEVWSKRFNEL
jgi:hypothetical protein